MIRNVELDFVSEGKLKYPGVNSKLFGNNIQVETEDEARNRLLQRIYEKYDAKHLTEYTAELSRYINLKICWKTEISSMKAKIRTC